MNFEKLIKQENGSTVKVLITFSTDFWDKNVNYNASIFVRGKGKHKFLGVVDEFRYLAGEEKRKAIKEQMNEFITDDQIYQAKLELWETLKPQR